MVSQQSSLADLGMDSMMAVEIKQTLERDFEIFLTAQDIRTLTLARLAELSEQKDSVNTPSTPARPLTEDAVGLQVLMRNFGDEDKANEPFIFLPTLVSDGSEIDVQHSETVMFVLPGLEGCAAEMAPLCSRLKGRICVLQYTHEERDYSLDDLVNRLFQTIKSRLNLRSPFILLGYGFGSLPTLKLAEIMEREGHYGTIFCIDSSPKFLYDLLSAMMPVKTDNYIQNKLICYTMSLLDANNDVTDVLMDKLKDIEPHDERIKYAINMCPPQQIYSDKFIGSMAKAIFDRVKIVLNKPEIKIKSPIVLLRPKENAVTLEENYGLDKVTEGPVTVHAIDGNHGGIIDKKECADIINRVLAEGSTGKLVQNTIQNTIIEHRSINDIV